MTTLEKIVSWFQENNISYHLLDHEAVFTSEQAARVRGTLPEQGAKALVMLGDKKPLMIVLPGNRRIDSKSFKSQFGIRDLRMETPEKVETLTGAKIGAVPPFGNLFGLPLYVDETLSANEKIVFNIGEHTKSAIISYKDFEKFCKPIKGKFVTIEGNAKKTESQI